MEAFIGLATIVYVVGCLFYFMNMAVGGRGIKVYDIIFLIIFLPMTIILSTVVILAISVEWIYKRVSETKMGEFLNKRIF